MGIVLAGAVRSELTPDGAATCVGCHRAGLTGIVIVAKNSPGGDGVRFRPGNGTFASYGHERFCVSLHPSHAARGVVNRGQRQV